MSFTVNAQVGINTDTPDSSSALDVSSTSKGVLLPRIENLSSITSPATGLTVYDTKRKCISQNIGNATTPNWACLSPYISKFFYMPSVVFNTSVAGNNLTKDLYTLYKNQFANVPTKQRSTSAPSEIPYFPNATDLYYYVIDFDSNVFEINSVSDSGVLNYNIKTTSTPATYINIVFVVK